MRRHKTMVVVLAMALLCFGLAVAVRAIDELNLFELDGNAVNDPLVVGDDWDTVLLGGGGASLVSSGLITDLPSDADDNFATGGSKDIYDVSSWMWTVNSVPNKDDLLHAFAAIYQDPASGHFIVYFGADRYADNGDAQLGFWFFQNAVGKNADGTFGGTHAVGDLLVLSDFTQGGSIPSISVYEWVGAGGSDGALNLIASGVDCATTASGDVVCGIVNSANQPSPWPFQSSGPHTPPDTFLPGEFFEAGLDLTALVPDAACLSSFLAETRSSTSLSAQLEDFVLGNFDTCKLTVEKTGPERSKVGDPTLYHITISNDGISTLYLESVDDTLAGDITSLAQANGCSSIPPGGSCSFDYSYVVQPGDPDPLLNTVTVVYNSKGDFSGIEVSGSASFSVNLFQPSVAVDKTADHSLAEVGDDVTYTFTITNTSSADSPDLILNSVTDDVLGDLTATAQGNGCSSLAPGASCSFTASRVIQAGDPNPLVNTVTVHYHPDRFPNDITATDTHSVSIFAPSVRVEKTGTTLSKVGDPATYTFTVTNTSTPNSPDLMLNSISDNVLGDLTALAQANGCSTLAPGASCSFSANYTVQPGDPDPLVNTVTVHYQPIGWTTDVTASATHTTNLFQPSVTVEKTGPALAKVGDTVTYSFTVTNTSSADSPNLILKGITDNVLGDLTGIAGANGCTSLPPGGSCSFTADYTVQPGDPDPLVNTVVVHYHPDGFPNDINAQASHTLNLFQPSVSVTKTGTELSKVGDPASYTFTITNTSSPDTPDLVLDSAVDSVLGVLTPEAQASCGTLAPGASCSFSAPYVVQPGDPDPLVNTIVVHYHPTGWAADVTASASHTTNLFQPSVTVEKTGPALAKVGDDVTYTFTITNTSSADSPNLILNSVTDDVLGDLTALAQANCGSLAPGASCSFNASRVVQANDPDPLVNTVTVHYHPDGFPNDITAQASHTVNLFQPSVSVTKTGTALSKVGDPASYTFTITNTSSADTPDLVLDSAVDSVLGVLTPLAQASCGTLAPGASCAFNAPYVVQPGDPDPLVNTIVIHYHPTGWATTDVTASASHTTNLFQPSVTVTKSCSPFAIPDSTVVQYDFTITNTSSADSPPLILANVTDSLLGDLTAVAQANCASLAPGQSCSFSASRMALGTDPNPLVNTVSVLFHPDGFPNNITATSSCSTTLIHPDGQVTKTCLTNPVPAGASANFRINVANVGDVPLIIHLMDPMLGIDETFNLGLNPNPPCGDLVNDPANGCFMVEGGYIATGTEVSNSATIEATLDPSYGIPGVVYSDTDTAVCTVTTEGGATRTQGFWATHCDYTQHVFNVHLGGSMDIGWKQLTGADDVFGIFWANNAKDSNNKKRNKLCQAREITANQVVAAILNTALTNGKQLPVPLATIQAIMAGTNIQAIKDLGSTLDAYNQSGDNQAIVDGDGYLIQPADPRCAKDLADIPFADCP